ncbi:MAG: outer membrane protein assembly factor BamB family protein, partial [Planctomycetota bacterium]
LGRHPVTQDLKRAQDLKTKYDAAVKGNASNVATLEESLRDAAARYEASRKNYEAMRAELEKNKAELEAFNKQGFKWRIKSPHQSAVIAAGGTLVVGGIGKVIGLNIETGERAFNLDVSGEVRGLAVSDGTLTVSTTEGRVYAFGDQTTPDSPATNASDTIDRANSPFARDDKSAVYAAAAEQIIANTGVTSGFCLVAGSEEGRLAYELLKRTDLKIYCIEADADKVARSREALLKTGLYGSRVIVDLADTAITPYANYFANLVVSDTMMLTGKVPGMPTQIARHLKPIGGVACLGAPEGSSAQRVAAQTLQPWLAATRLLEENATIQTHGSWTLLKRGKLPNTDDWTHQYGNAANTSSNDDRRVSEGLKVLWYGDPGPGEMINRHQGAVGPVSADGRLFVQGDESVMAYDAYNGEFLWKRDNPGALRTGVYNNYEPGNMVATGDSLFMVIGDRCYRYDAATGDIKGEYLAPKDERTPDPQWGYIGVHDGVLYGTTTSRELIAEDARRRGKTAEMYATDQIFAYAPNSGKLLWTYRGKNISHTTIAIGDGRVFFVDSTLTAEQREALLLEDKTELKKLTGEARKIAEDRAKRHDLRLTVAIDSQTGKQLWAKPVDVTDCSGVGIGAGQLTVMYSKGYVLICGANANGHYWKQFLNGDFSRRRLLVLNADTGAKEWALDANYRHRPILIGQDIIAEPWSFDLCTGEQKMRTHPLTGEQTPWSFVRPGHHCGAISATPAMLFYRSRFTAFYNMESDEGTQHFAGQRMGCWINSIPAGGLVLVPEASAGCVCLFSIASTVVFEPAENDQVWGVYSASKDVTPVKHMALNLGAPGDRRDPYGKLWLSYPRPSMEKIDAKRMLELPINLNPKFETGGDYYAFNSESVTIDGAETNWVHTSGARGLQSARIKLNDEGAAASDYAVTLNFTSNAGDQPNQRVFDIKLQGKTVARDVDIVARAGGDQRVVSLTFDGVRVTDDIAIELAPKKTGAANQPLITSLELLRDGEQPIIH